MDVINYFTLFGLFFILVAGAILAGFPSKVRNTKKEHTELFLGGDPYVKKNQMIREYEAKVGFCCLILGAALQIIGLLTNKGNLSLPCPTIGVVGCATVAIVTLFVIPPLTYKWSSKKINPYFVKKYREMFEKAEDLIINNGLYKYEVNMRGLALTSKDKEERLANATKHLDLIGDMVDIPRMEGESNKEFLEKLKPSFSTGSNNDH
jgi:hypothetical protein